MSDRESRVGRCYELAFWKFMDGEHPDAVLVHGYPRYRRPGEDQNRKFGHAWLEYDSPRGPVCWDPTNDMEIGKLVYYMLGHIENAECVRYETVRSVCEVVLKHEHFGPWTPIPEGTIFCLLYTSDAADE